MWPGQLYRTSLKSTFRATQLPTVVTLGPSLFPVICLEIANTTRNGQEVPRDASLVCKNVLLHFTFLVLRIYPKAIPSFFFYV